GGRTSQELGAGRIVGQMMVHLYLQKDAQSLDSIGEALGLSKASVSIAVRQLEQLGLVRRVWVKGDRKKYYRSVDNIGSGLQQGLLSFLRQKVVLFGTELEGALAVLESVSPDDKDKEEFLFLQQRMNRAGKLQKILLKILGNPLVNFLAKNIK
ncbi:MAG: MarR family transcriptional regulator, partial [Candidatus Electrothrix sp. AR5]|nr:MarR family transcriptional regulator [Candidatus Electrothrix sp. AR5]